MQSVILYSRRGARLPLRRVLLAAGLAGVCWMTPALAAPPAMPGQFDQPTVERLIQTLDQDRNTMVLKYGYFLRRGTPPFAISDGLKALETAAGAAPAGSTKWFVLQDALAFGWTMSGQKDNSAGYAAYGRIFDQAVAGVPAESWPVVEGSIREFAAFLPTRLAGGGSRKLGRPILIKALQVYLENVSKPGASARRVRWQEALKEAGIEKQAAELVTRLIPKGKASYAFMRSAADIYAQGEPALAPQAFADAKLLLPAAAQAKQDPRLKAEVTAFYGQWVAALTERGKLKEAIQAQRELVGLLGEGQADLLVLHYRNHDPEAARLLINDVAAKSPDQEIVAAALAIGTLTEESAYAKETSGEAGRLLVAYLQAPRERSAVLELRARLLAGHNLSKTQPDEAIRVLEAAVKPNANEGAKLSYYDEIQELLTGLKRRPRTATATPVQP